MQKYDYKNGTKKAEKIHQMSSAKIIGKEFYRFFYNINNKKNTSS
jgi:hypothetical protein